MPDRRIVLAIFLSSIGGARGVHAAQEVAKPGDLEGLDPFVERTMADWKMPGLALAVIKDGRVIHSRGYGLRDVEKGLPVTSKTLFAIGSISKSFTVTGLAMLADEGKLDWDRPVRDAWPEFRLKDRALAEAVTPRDLLTHRTGLPRHDLVWFRSGLSRPQLLDAIRHLDASRELRAEWQYNNLMYLAAGSLIERLAGRSWEDFTRERIFKPLGMAASNFSVEDSKKVDDHARPYSKVGKDIRLISFCNIDAIAPAGSINSNVEEMIRYVRLQLDSGKYEGKSLFSPTMAGRMQSPQMVIADEDAGPLHAPTFAELGHTSYGSGLFVTTYRGHKLVWHSGSIDGFSALMAFLPREKVGLIVLTNLSGNRPVPVCVARYVFDRALGLEPIDWAARAKEIDRKAETSGAEGKSKAAAERKPNTSPSHPLPSYAGLYEHPAYGSARIGVEGGRLKFSWRGGSAPLTHRHYDVFDTEVGDDADDDDTVVPKARVTFGYDSKGEIDRMSMPLESEVADIVFTRRRWPRIATTAAEPLYDVVLLGGRVVDGSGNPWFLGDVAVRGDRIARVVPAGLLRDAPTRVKIDAKGMVIAPGFIDIQGHSRDELLTGDGRVIGKVTQGVTTEILGEGTSNAPSK